MANLQNFAQRIQRELKKQLGVSGIDSLALAEVLSKKPKFKSNRKLWGQVYAEAETLAGRGRQPGKKDFERALYKVDVKGNPILDPSFDIDKDWGKEAQMTGEQDLRETITKLAQNNPELREHLLPLLKQANKPELSGGWVEKALLRFSEGVGSLAENLNQEPLLRKDKKFILMVREAQKVQSEIQRYLSENYHW